MYTECAYSDAEAVQRTLAGHREAFEILLMRYTRMAYAVAFARLGRHEEAEDMVQEAWIQAFQTLHRLREPGKFRSWFAVIVRNLSINIANKRRRERPLDDTRENPMADMRQQLEDADMQQALWSQIVYLMPDHREVLTLHYHAGMNTEEIAEAIGESRETVKKRLQRARAALSNQAVHTLLEPARQDEEKFRKRVMGLLILLPVSWDKPIATLPAAAKPWDGFLAIPAAKTMFMWAVVSATVFAVSAATAAAIYWRSTPPSPVPVSSERVQSMERKIRPSGAPSVQTLPPKGSTQSGGMSKTRYPEADLGKKAASGTK